MDIISFPLSDGDVKIVEPGHGVIMGSNNSTGENVELHLLHNCSIAARLMK